MRVIPVRPWRSAISRRGCRLSIMAKTMTPFLPPAKTLRQSGKQLRALGGASGVAIAYLTDSECGAQAACHPIIKT
ncbi:hypothetical protein AGR1C_pAt40068 [Agrobacterium fabacearum TT111]|nr:hypothetical protein AGR1C_pAt40068 [Agrobacterium fabacearum TT111]